VHLAKLVNDAIYRLTGAQGQVTPWNVVDLPADDVDDLLALVKKANWYAEIEAEKKKAAKGK
jgi:hypothetical protein